MLLKDDLQKLLMELNKTDIANINLGGSSITVQATDQHRKISLTTPVYFGGNYIPKSVRNCLKQKNPFDQYSIRTNLRIDEENFRIYLNYFGDLSSMNNRHFVNILEDFSELAEQWRQHLDEHDQNDLVYINAHP